VNNAASSTAFCTPSGRPVTESCCYASCAGSEVVTASPVSRSSDRARTRPSQGTPVERPLTRSHDLRRPHDPVDDDGTLQLTRSVIGGVSDKDAPPPTARVVRRRYPRRCVTATKGNRSEAGSVAITAGRDASAGDEAGDHRTPPAGDKGRRQVRDDGTDAGRPLTAVLTRSAILGGAAPATKP